LFRNFSFCRTKGSPTTAKKFFGRPVKAGLAFTGVVMKRFLMVLGLTAVLGGTVFAQMSKGGTVYVNVKTLQLKSGTGFFAGKSGSPLAYGDQVTVLQVKGKWAEVRYSGSATFTGWTNSSNLTTKRVVASGGTGGASAKEVAMAGKGFNEEVENAYKSNGSLNYADVDATEAITVPESELYSFITEGHLIVGDN
jgi:uncharacterized protein YgiM (DUF1202 family)